MGIDHDHYMRLAIAEAKKAAKAPFGCVIADRATGAVVSTGINRTEENPLLHGEIDACLKLRTSADTDLKNLVLFSTAEPCPMCQSAVVWAGIGKVVYGTSIQSLIQYGWRQIEISSNEIVERSPFAKCEIIGGVLEEDCDALYLRR